MQYLKCHSTAARELDIHPTEREERDAAEASGSIQLPQGHDTKEAFVHLKTIMQDEVLANPNHDFYIEINDNNLMTYWVDSPA